MHDYRQGDILHIERVEYVVVKRNKTSPEYEAMFPGRKTYTLKRPRGRNLYYVTCYENGTFSTPIGMPVDSRYGTLSPATL